MSEQFIPKNETAFVGIKANLRDALESIEHLEDAAARVPALKARQQVQRSYRAARDSFPHADALLFRKRLDNPSLVEKNPAAPERLFRMLGLLQ